MTTTQRTVRVTTALLVDLQEAQATAQLIREDIERVTTARRLLEEFGAMSGSAYDNWKSAREAAYGLYLVLTEDARLVQVRANDAETALYRALEAAERLALALPERIGR